MERKYNAKTIKVLKGLAAVRKRPAMYIGGTSERGLHHLVYEVVDNSIDEAMSGYCDKISITLNEDGSVTVKDNGRGIPVDMHKEMQVPAVQVVMTKLHAGGKFDNKTYKISGGLHGVGVSVVNALAKYLEVKVYLDGKIYTQKYEKGFPKTDVEEIGKTKDNGTEITFIPDDSIFEVADFNFDTLSSRLRELAFLNKGLEITLIDKKEDKKHDFKYSGGINSFVKYLNKNKTNLLRKPIYIQGTDEEEKVEFEVSIQYNDGYQANIYSFANNINTIEGGTHLSGFKAALTRSVNGYIKDQNLLKNKKLNPTGRDVREGITAVISVKLPEPQFEGQTKTKLQNSNIKGIISSTIYEKLNIFFEEHPKQAKKLSNKAIVGARSREAAKKGKRANKKKICFGER